ncbi:DNA mismatch repair protein MLH3 isoform X2 [Pistacia vera]|uniref:DNA mismatch repair protein MLH3 isoform X2 n=1 Tax=Pistacia vera TaxID=55513 RepID=UPI00126315EE|nr:DNA mismatch repair protein MLH3 isoform X2 [Pistacia vera]
MGTIKRLPETVRNTVRSGVVLFDLTRVVEELVFNSLDAGATKVSVFVGVGTSFVKVVDNGCGISRDGLMLLGERYATSKLQHLADMDAASRTFGYRGEALASISDVSLLEIMTKAYGRPNGYCKVMKGSKCLYLGIDDDRKEVGTTVVARDLFYNQPVRRKYMQSSPKKVLHLVKKCVFRIALVHSKASFKVVDIESEDELLSTHFASSPLSLLRSGFGIEDSSFLHEISAKDGVLRISGYISSPCDSFSMKTFQYVYINSRFICKGPIHKLVNNLASNFDCLDSWKANNGSQKGKKSRSQVCPTYILNLGCPQALYDLTFEPSKTYVVFKDWEPVLTLIEKAVQTVWMKDIVYGESFSHAADKLGKDELWKKHDNLISAGEAGLMKNLHRSSGECHPNLNSSSEEDLELSMRPTILKKPDTVINMKKTQKVENFKQLQCLQAHHAANIKDFISKEILDSIDSGTKWRNSCPQATVENNNRSSDIDNQDNILDISSGLLHLAGDSLIPESISKNCLEYAKVLQQVDKKFIPIVAGGTLALIDQHAADERIRLEELRRKVLSEEGKTVTYLDAEQELVLPEIGYQLLHNYAQQMKDWGWICNIHNQGSRSFKKNLNLLHQRPTIVTLLAVPCILGVNLSDVDLLEFLQQLADTDGSSTVPPAVLRVLNSKACRGAIMFGDSLLPSECSLIVEELKHTSLCFQCAHGRPTTVPLVHLEALHKQIAQLRVLNDNSSESWHGLHRHEMSLERANQRLRAARG